MYIYFSRRGRKKDVSFYCNSFVFSIPSSALFKLGARLVVPLGQPINTVFAENTNYRSLQCADLNDIVKDKGIPYYNKGEKKN